ncbi:MAG: cyclic nucleotide-binding domain-containing protein, partial [Anaerolineales bacterium]
AEDFDPYPGEFLKDTLDDKILKTNLILALDYLTKDRVTDAQETIRNIWLAQTKAIPVENPFIAYLKFQRRWRALRRLTGRELGAAFSSIIQSGNIHREEVEMAAEAMRAEFEQSGGETLLLLIRDLPLFKGLKADQIQGLLSLSKREFFDKGDILITEGSKEHALYVITKGKARITLGNDSEEVTELIDVGVGETLGEVSLLIDVPHSATVTALEPMEVITFTRLSLATLMADNPELAAEVWHRLAQSLSGRLRHSNERYISHIRETYDVADELLGTQPLDEL